MYEMMQYAMPALMGIGVFLFVNHWRTEPPESHGKWIVRLSVENANGERYDTNFAVHGINRDEAIRAGAESAGRRNLAVLKSIEARKIA